MPIQEANGRIFSENQRVIDAVDALNNALDRVKLPEEVRQALVALRDVGRNYYRELPRNVECNLDGLKQRIDLELPAINEDLRERIQYVVTSIINNSTDGEMKASLIPDSQRSQIAGIKMVDQKRSGGFAVRWLISPIRWIFVDHQYNPAKWFLGDEKRLNVYKTAGNDAFEALIQTRLEGAKKGHFRKAIKKYNEALHYAKNDQQRFPIYFKMAQAYLVQTSAEKDFQKDLRDKELLLFNDEIARRTYGCLRTDLLYLSEVINKSTSVIQTVLGALVNYYDYFAKEAREGREGLEQYMKGMPSLEPIREALLKAPDLDIIPDVRIAIEDLPKNYKNPDELQKALDQYYEVISKMMSLDSSFEMSQLCANQQNQLEILDLSQKIYRQKYEQIQIYVTLIDLISTVTEFFKDVKMNQKDVLNHAEHSPETLVHIYNQLQNLGDLNKLPLELVNFKADMAVIREGFIMRATAAEKMGRVLSEFFEKLSSRHPEKTAKDALKSLKLSYGTSEDCYLIAYKDYRFASAMLNTAVTARKKNLEKRRDAAYEALLAAKPEEERSQVWRDQVEVEGEEEDKKGLAKLQPLVDLCKGGINRVIKLMINNPNITGRGKMIFSDFMEEDPKNIARNHIVSGKLHCVMDSKNPVAKYAMAIDEFQKALKVLLELRSKEGKVEEQEALDKQIKEVRISLKRATLMKKAADSMELVYKIVDNPSLAMNASRDTYMYTRRTDNKVSRTQVFQTLQSTLKEAWKAEYEALYVGAPKEKEKLSDAEKKTHLSKLASTEKTNYIELSQMAAELATKVNDANKADEMINNATAYTQRGFKNKGDYKPLDLDKMERLIAKLKNGEITAQQLEEDSKKKAALPFLDDIAKSGGRKRQSL